MLHIESEHASLKKLDDQGFGKYHATLKTNDVDRIPLLVHIQDPPSKNPSSNFVIDAPSLRFPPYSPLQSLVLVSYDNNGNPVKNTPFKIDVLKGDVTVPKEGKTNKYGFAYINLQPGEKEGEISLKIYNENYSSTHTLFQLYDTTAPSLYNLPVSGQLETQSHTSSWRNSISTLTLQREVRGMIGENEMSSYST